MIYIRTIAYCKLAIVVYSVVSVFHMMRMESFALLATNFVALTYTYIYLFVYTFHVVHSSTLKFI